MVISRKCLLAAGVCIYVLASRHAYAPPGFVYTCWFRAMHTRKPVCVWFLTPDHEGPTRSRKCRT